MSKVNILLAGAFAALATSTFAQEGEVYLQWDNVEVLDVENDVWDPCVVLTHYPGAYKVSCQSGQTIRRDIHVRKVGEQAAAQTAAVPVVGNPFKRNDIVLASPIGVPTQWELCIVIRNEVNLNNSFVLNCGYDDLRVTPRWVRKDPKAPAP